MQTKRLTRMARSVSTALAALAVGVAAPGASAAQFSDADLYFELNDTDGDLGLHGKVDGGPYKRLEIEGPNDRELLILTARGGLAKQGMTELFFESAEPHFDELSPEKFFRRFPEGEYEIEGTTHSGQEFEATDEISHVMAAPPGNITVGGLPAAEDCDAALPTVSGMVVVDWDEVTGSHPEIGESGDVVIAHYQFVVEHDDITFTVDLAADTTEFMIPADVLAFGGEFKFEIVARTDTGNNTAVETCFLYD